jgi:uncharacterized membrane protein
VRATMLGILMLGLLVLANVILALAYYPLLPDRVAGEFDLVGAAKGWQPKSVLLLGHLGVALGLAFGFVPLLYAIVRFCPARTIDMPHKDYWLAEPRQRQARGTMFRHVLWLMNFTLAFLGALFYLVYRANLTATPRLGQGFWVVLAIFLIGITVWVVRFYRSFRIPAGDSPSEPA